VSYLASIRESVNRILATAIGDRVMEPEFGSLLHTLIDRRVDQQWRLDFTRFCFEAIERWEPRVEVKRVSPAINNGEVTATIELKIIGDGEQISIEVKLNG
jgi:phage baseplate assembly protein W